MQLFGQRLNYELPPEFQDGRVEERTERLFAGSALPTTAEEDWRYGKVGELDLTKFVSINPLDPDTFGEHDAVVSRWKSLLGGTFDVVLVVESSRLRTSEVTRPQFVRVSTATSHETEAAENVVEPFGVLAEILSVNPLTVTFSEGPAKARVLIVNLAPSGMAISTSSVNIRLDAGVEAEVIEVRTGGEGGLCLALTKAELGRDASLNYLSIEDLSEDAWELAQLDLVAETNAKAEALHLALGGSYARLRTECDLIGANAEARIFAGYLGGADQTLEFRTFQNHRAPKTTSDLLYKGALAGASHSIYTGMIRVDRGAHGTNAFQTNRNIVLGDQAHADSVPNLDIEENDVRCSHASAVGPVDADQLYYLESKGIPTQAAERLIVGGFFRELVQGIGDGSLGGLIEERLAVKW